jgi:molybdate transport system permease protein
VRRIAFSVFCLVATVLALSFLLLPILAIFLRVSPGDLLGKLDDGVVRDALVVTAVTNGIAFGITLVVGTPAAYLLATRRFQGRAFVLTLCELPLVMPPAVAGIGLLAAFGRLGLLGSTLDTLGVRIGFTQAAVVLAILFVAGPFYLRPAIAAFETVDPTLLAAARTLGAGPGRTFLRVALPLAGTGLSAAAALSLARGIGEFGATIMFAGSLQGVTQTLSLAIYRQFDVDFTQALAMGALLVVLSAAVLLTIKLVPTWRRSSSTSPALFAPSISR